MAARLGVAVYDRKEQDIEQMWRHGIHKVEREFGILITEEFLLLKFLNLLEFCEYCEQEKEEQEREMSRKR